MDYEPDPTADSEPAPTTKPEPEPELMPESISVQEPEPIMESDQMREPAPTSMPEGILVEFNVYPGSCLLHGLLVPSSPKSPSSPLFLPSPKSPSWLLVLPSLKFPALLLTFRSPALPWCEIPLALPQASKPWPPPQPVDPLSPCSFHSTVLHHPPSSFGLLCPSGSTLASHHPGCSMDFRASSYTLSLHPFDSAGLLLPSRSTFVLTPTGSALVC